jgi:transposase-like protein
MSETKRRYSGNEKVSILRKHLLDKITVSDICKQYQIHPTQFYRWQKEFFENGPTIFNHKNKDKQVESELRKENDSLKSKIQRKNEVVSELMEEYLKLKKKIGEK